METIGKYHIVGADLERITNGYICIASYGGAICNFCERNYKWINLLEIFGWNLLECIL